MGAVNEYNQSDAVEARPSCRSGDAPFAAKHGECGQMGVIGCCTTWIMKNILMSTAISAEIMRERALMENHPRCVHHGYGICTDVKPHFMEKVLYAIDELTGLINAVA